MCLLHRPRPIAPHVLDTLLDVDQLLYFLPDVGVLRVDGGDLLLQARLLLFPFGDWQLSLLRPCSIIPALSLWSCCPRWYFGIA